MKKAELMPCAVAIHAIIMKPNQLQAVARKYKSSRFNHIYNSVPIKTPAREEKKEEGKTSWGCLLMRQEGLGIVRGLVDRRWRWIIGGLSMMEVDYQ